MKISLIRPIYKTESFDPEMQEPLGIETLAGFLAAHGHTIQILDAMLTGQSERNISRQVATFRPSVVGFSLMNAGELESTNHLIEYIKSYDPKIKFVAGGNLVSTEPYTAVNHLPVGTVCIRYEGELPWLDVINAIEQSLPPSSIGSGVFINGEGSITETPVLVPLSDLDEIPFAARPFIHEIIRRDLAVNLQGSRGCVGTCHYCCNPGFPKAASGRRRDRNPSRIVDEIQSIVNVHPAAIINFVDDDFLGEDQSVQERAECFAEEIRKRGLKISFGIQARPYSLNENIIRLMASAGLNYVFFGLENDDESTLQNWGRGRANFNLSDLVKNLRNFDIEPQAGCIPFHPDTNIQNIKRLSTTLKINGLLNYRTATNRLQAIPGSALYRDLEQANQVDTKHSGPFFPEFNSQNVDVLYKQLIKALEPLRAIWAYAACKLPVIKAKSKFEDKRYSDQYVSLQKALLGLNKQIAASLFHLIDRFESGSEKDIDMSQLRASGFQISMEMNKVLFRSGLVDSEDFLREIIRVDSGL